MYNMYVCHSLLSIFNSITIFFLHTDNLSSAILICAVFFSRRMLLNLSRFGFSSINPYANCYFAIISSALEFRPRGDPVYVVCII